MRTAALFAALWASAVTFAETVPLPEHPRPDWERAAWLNLNGEWDFGFAAGKYDRKILVPFGWDSPASGVKDEGDTGFYRRSITVPAAWKGKRVFVVVGAADHDTNCLFDGADLGKHTGGYTPFEFELTEFVKWGEQQTLEFKIWDPPAKVAREGHWLYGKQGYGNARGIWQTVYLEARGPRYVDSVRFYPHLKGGTVTAAVTLDLPAAAPMTAKLMFDGSVHEVPFKAGEIKAAATFKLKAPRLWTLEDPYLYNVTVFLNSNTSNNPNNSNNLTQSDTVRTYFGFREIGTGKNPNGDPYVTLNGKPIYLQLCLDQSYHPEGWYTFPSDEVMKNEILISKRLALSGNRVHIKVEVPRKLYWADKLGVLIQADVPCAWGEASEAMFEEHWMCFEDMVKRDFNHPSIYQWTLFNETWGLFSRKLLPLGKAAGNEDTMTAYRPETQRRVAMAYARAKVLDPTRIVEENSACNNDHVITDVNTWHAYHPGYRWESVVRERCEKTFPGSTDNYIGGLAQRGEPMMNSECGNVWGYQGSTGDCDFTWDYHLMMNAFRRHLKCSGWLYTEHHDVCNEWNGYVRFDRSPKYDGMDELAGMTLADFHRDAFLFFAGTPGKETGEMLAPGQKVTIPVGVSFTTDKYAGKVLKLQVDGVFYEQGKVAKSWQCEELWTYTFRAPESPACGVVRFVLRADDKEIARNFWSYGVTNAAPANVVASKSEWSGGMTNVLGGLKQNGFGKGFFEFVLPAPVSNNPTIQQSNNSFAFRAELSAKRKNGKDCAKGDKPHALDYMLGGGSWDRSKNPNSYPQTSDVKFPSTVKVFIGGALVKTVTLADDPADHRGILSWLSQLRDGRLREAGSYGWLVETPVPADAVRDGKVMVRLEADNGLAVYGPAFGRYPLGPHIGLAK